MKTNMKNIVSKIIAIILNVLMVIAIILIMFGIYYLIEINVLNKDYANFWGYTFFEVATGSMADTINVGDVVVVKITKDVKANDIIVYKEENNYITHRLIEKNGKNLITKGDANNTEDFPIEINEVLGKVFLIIPKIGIIRKVLLSKEVIGLIVILIILIAVLGIYNNKTEDKDEN